MADRLLIASLTGPDGESLRLQSAAARGHVDWLEIRLDLLKSDWREAVAPLRDDGKPLLLTVRTRHEGGQDERPAGEIARELLALAGPNDFIDWEASRGAPPECAPERLIISRHIAGPATAKDLNDALSGLIAHPARFYKLIFTAERMEDCLDARAVLKRASGDGIPLCCFAMGDPGVPSRLLALSWGSVAVFGAPPGWSGASPGQLPVDQMAGLYQIREIGPKTALLGVAGNPVLHSLSPALHNPRLRDAGFDAVYLPLPAEDFNDLLHFARQVDLRAASITTPFKNPAYGHAGKTTPEADAAQAVNLLLFKDGRPVAGDTTDGEGVVVPLTPWLHFPKMARVLIVGTGPAGRAAGAGLRALGTEIDFTARSAPRDTESLPGNWLEPADALARKYSILINATPVPAPRWEKPLIALLDAAPPVVLEMPYRDEAPPRSYPHGVKVVSGREMLRAQGAAQARIFAAHLRGE